MKERESGHLALGIVAFLWIAFFIGPLAQGEPRDPELRFALKHDLLVRINEDRAEHGLSPVQLDPHASQIADAYCERQIRNRTTGHYTVDGLAPYMRYSFAGGNDGLSENAAAWSANYDFSDNVIPELIWRSQDAMLAEKPPDDGHRRTILDPHATHVGLGLAWDKGEFRLAQEFLRRYVDWTEPLPRTAVVGEHVAGGGSAIQGYRVDALSIYHEPFPQPITAMTANRINTYSLPKNRRDHLPRSATAARIARTRSQADLVVRRDGTFAVSVPFVDGPGVYTIVVWVRKRGERSAIASSNVSIRVDQPIGFHTSAFGSR
ncbi:MAG TPA: CAP domain-containing protein [Thermoanaerobaculia bacterium]